MKQHKTVSIDHIETALRSLPQKTELCAAFEPKGVPVQLMYEGFGLSRGYTENERCEEITHILDQVPQLLTDDYLWSSCHGDFDLFGHLWISSRSFRYLNEKRINDRQLQYRTPEEAIQLAIVNQDDAEQVKRHLRFTPYWSHDLINQSVFLTYEDFLKVMQNYFPMEEYHRLTAEKISELIPTFQVKAGYNDTDPRGNVAKLNRMRIYQNELSPTEHYIGDDALIASVPFHKEAQDVVVTDVSIQPDRFGCQRPLVRFTDDLEEEDAETVALSSIKTLEERDYHIGDVVQMNYVGDVAVPGKILRRGYRLDPWNYHHDVTVNRVCGACCDKITSRHGEFYCTNEYCQEVMLSRLHFACSPSVLNIPIEKCVIDYIWCAKDFPVTLARFLTDGWQEFRDVLKDGEVTRLIQTLIERASQLHGTGYDRDTQLQTKGKFLTALSIPGLHSRNIQKLLRPTPTQDWYWAELYDVLSNAKTLLQFGLPPDDVRLIFHAAKRREEELVETAAL